MIVILTGQSGNGKSSYFVMLIKQMVEQGRPVFTIGIPKLKLPVIEWKRSQLRLWHEIDLPSGYTLDDLEREGAIYDHDGNEIPCPLKHLPDGAAIFVDEGQKSWAPTGSKSTPDQLALSMHRHWGLDFFVASQSPRFLHQSLTENCSQHLHIHKTWRGSVMYQYAECQVNPTAASVMETAYKKKYKPDPASFELYESASEHTKLKYPIPIKAIAAGVTFLLLPIAAYAIYNVISQKKDSPVQKDIDKKNVVIASNPQTSNLLNRGQFLNNSDWFIVGFSKFNENYMFVLENDLGVKRYVYDATDYRIQGSFITLRYQGALYTNAMFKKPFISAADPSPKLQ